MGGEAANAIQRSRFATAFGTSDRATAAKLAADLTGDDPVEKRIARNQERSLESFETCYAELIPDSRADPAEVVQVMARAVVVGAVAPERAVDRPGREGVRRDAQAGRDAGPEALDHDVGARAQCAAERRLGLEIADDRFLARVEQRIPFGRDIPHRVALRRLEPHDARAKAEQLAGRERPREVAGQVDDEQSLERPWLHGFGS